MAQRPLRCKHCRSTPMLRSRRQGMENLTSWLTGMRPYRCERCLRRNWHRVRFRDNPGQYIVPRLILVTGLIGIIMLQFPQWRPDVLRRSPPMATAPQPPEVAARPGPQALQPPSRPARPTPAPATIADKATPIARPTAQTATAPGPTPAPATRVPPQPAATASPVYRPTARVNLRSGPGTRFPSLGLLTPDSRLRLTGDSDGEWVEVTDGQAEGWIYRPLITAG